MKIKCKEDIQTVLNYIKANGKELTYSTSESKKSFQYNQQTGNFIGIIEPVRIKLTSNGVYGTPYLMQLLWIDRKAVNQAIEGWE